jgi:hypothetical protein
MSFQMLQEEEAIDLKERDVSHVKKTIEEQDEDIIMKEEKEDISEQNGDEKGLSIEEDKDVFVEAK